MEQVQIEGQGEVQEILEASYYLEGANDLTNRGEVLGRDEPSAGKMKIVGRCGRL